MELRHLRPKGKGTKQYRRRIPKPLQEIAGKEWWHRTVKATSHPALVNAHAQAEAAFERDVKLWERQQALSSNTAPTPAMLYALGQRRATELLSGVIYGGDPEEEDIAGLVRDSIGSRYPKDPDTGHPLGVTPLDTATVQALGRMGPPERNLRDAKAHYIKERLGGGQSPDDRKMMERVERVFALLAEALGDRMDAPLSVLQLKDGRTERVNDFETVGF